ncbi:MAG: UDP-N-acetylmuramate dehydrogenase [Patescibacteria group bacterium]|jgi:UDP-N-acetylmuramate dehydrogenase|nr:UDP-N-acetylmuramate dehydrogenase [Patescibacteria group bacterium]
MNILKDELLSKYSTFKIGGKAKYFCVVKSLEEFKKAYLWAESESLQTFILGGGSNVLFSDTGFEGLVIKLENRELEKLKEKVEKILIKCEAGVDLAGLVKYCVENGYEGLEWAAGIPGTFGGAVRGNAGAFGSTIGNSTKEIEIIRKSDVDLKQEVIKKENCSFGYRESFIKKEKNLVLWAAIIELKKGEENEIQEKFQKYIEKRQKKQPPLGKFPSAGSVFKNPVAPRKVVELFEEEKEVEAREGRVPAGWLIDRCGLKNKKIGGAMVSDIQANFVVNMGNATSEDVMILMSIIKQKVRNKFGIQLEEEVHIAI